MGVNWCVRQGGGSIPRDGVCVSLNQITSGALIRARGVPSL